MGNPPTKGQLKELLNKEIDKYWKNEWEVEKQGKSSLKYLTIQENPTRNTHTIWKTTKLNPRSVAKTSVKVKILTGNYTLQANRQKYNQHEVSPICKLCNLEPEDREHFTLRCPILETKRNFYVHQLFELLRAHSKEQLLNIVREEQEKLMLCIRDCTNAIFNLDVKKELDIISEIEEITRNLTFDLYNCRAVNIKNCL
jgi:hypothetical protein